MSMVIAVMAIQAIAAPPASVPPASAEVAHGEVAGPPAPPKPKPKVPAPLAPAGCSTSVPTDPGVVVVCAPPPQGYRIDPDVIRAKQIAHNHTLPKPREMLHDNSCQVVGPGGCMNNTGINVVGAALFAAKLAKTAIEGGNVGRLFVTNPQPTEYEIYLAAKADREAAERDQAAQAAALAAKTRRGEPAAP
ncbi:MULTISPECIES: hypothetical protein [Sphingomonas]|uniref:hypothetical protein n=1 Tax=Sphingomonas TaxID=13687 RepID=UPI00126A5453|nr:MULTISPECIES: hypothetical protein [Sphingomonas]